MYQNEGRNIVQFWRECAFYETKWDIPTVLYYSGMMFKYYSRLGFLPIKRYEEGKYIHNEIFKNIPHFIKKRLHIDCIQDSFVMYKNKEIIRKIEVIPPITDYMIPMDCCQKIHPSLLKN